MRRKAQPGVGNGWPERVTTQPLEAHPVSRADGDPGMQVEAARPGVASTGAVEVGRG
jgi:hypothetical protein